MSRGPRILVLAVLFVVAVGFAAVVLTRDRPDSNTTPDTDVTADVTVTGTPLPDQGPEDDAAVGRKAPVLEGTDLDGDPITVPSEGRPQAVLFVAHWCPHCQREVEALVSWLEDNDLPDGTELIAVSTLVDRSRGNYPPDKWLKGANWTLPVFVDDGASSAADAYGLTATPLWVFVDEKGEVALRAVGELEPDDLAEILADL